MEAQEPPFPEPGVFTAKDYIGYIFRKRGISLPPSEVPKTCIIAYSTLFLDYAKEHFNFKDDPIDTGSVIPVPVYLFKPTRQQHFGVVTPYPGDANAGITLEELIAIGFQNFLSTGLAGHPTVYDTPILKRGDLILATSALSYEGTSKHYTNKTILTPNESLTEVLRKTLYENKIPFVEGAVATTSGFYRETPSFIKEILFKGALGIDMETSALFAVAESHQRRLATLLCIADFVKIVKEKREWDVDFLAPDVLEALRRTFGIAMDFVNRL